MREQGLHESCNDSLTNLQKRTLRTRARGEYHRAGCGLSSKLNCGESDYVLQTLELHHRCTRLHIA